MYFDAIIAGFGGQGILVMGDLLAYADEEIGSPITVSPRAAIVMNEASLDKYQPMVKPDGLLFVNASFIAQEKVTRTDVDVVSIAANDLAARLGNSKMSNMVVLGAFVERTGIVELQTVKNSLPVVLPERSHKFIPLNIDAMEVGAEFCRKCA